MELLCIVSDAEGLSENVLHENTGWVVPKRNPEKLANTILEIVALAVKEKDIIRTNAVERVQNEFGIVKQQREFLSFYEID